MLVSVEELSWTTRVFASQLSQTWMGLHRKNESPLIGSLCLRKDFWDRHEANIATRMAKGCFDVGKKILERDYRSFASVLPKINLGNINTRVA